MVLKKHTTNKKVDCRYNWNLQYFSQLVPGVPIAGELTRSICCNRHNIHGNNHPRPVACHSTPLWLTTIWGELNERISIIWNSVGLPQKGLGEIDCKGLTHVTLSNYRNTSCAKWILTIQLILVPVSDYRWTIPALAFSHESISTINWERNILTLGLKLDLLPKYFFILGLPFEKHFWGNISYQKLIHRFLINTHVITVINKINCGLN